MEGKVRMGSLLDIDAIGFGEAFARRSVAVHHELVEHPLFTMEAIAELADRLPPQSLRVGLIHYNTSEEVDRLLAELDAVR